MKTFKRGCIVFITAAWVATSAYAVITATTGDILEVPAPASTDLGATESETNIFAFQEQAAGYVLPVDIDVNISQPGTYIWPGGAGGNPALTPATLGGGMRVDGVYLLHFDRQLVAGFKILTGSVSFECPVVGINVLTSELDASDILGAPGTIYPTGTQPHRGLEREEFVTLSSDRMTLTVGLELEETNGDNTLDQVRVVTACEQQRLDGRMTGGGSNFTANRVRITKGFQIHCDLSVPNNLQVNWPGNRFHLTSLTNAVCTEDPNIIQAPPAAPFDTFTGDGIGRLNGDDGATIHFVFVDAGEPGSSDTVSMVIRDLNNNIVLNLPVSFVDRGNLQAHDD